MENCTQIKVIQVAIAVAVVIIGDMLAQSTNIVTNLQLAIKEAYDDNVYLQDTKPSAVASHAMPAKKGSWITTISPAFTLRYNPMDQFNISLSYNPDIVFYHNAHSEDHFAHRIGIGLGGKVDNIDWGQTNSITYIDGDSEGPLFARPQDVPAIGGIPLRDRRDALIYRGNIKLTYSLERFFIRPVGSAYIHDFRTKQKLPSQVPAPYVYVNFLDRQDVGGGVDLGYRLMPKASLLIGYRYGRQDQFKGPSVFNPNTFTDSPFDSEYHRILGGVEGNIFPWLNVAILAGPDIRNWTDKAKQVKGFHSSEILYWVDASINIIPTKQDTFSIVHRRFELPASTSQSVYEDITYNINWRHKFTDQLNSSIGFQLYIGDWQAPVQREDWIYTISASINYSFNKHLNLELTYSYDWVENQVSTTAAKYAEGREFTRHIGAATIRYKF